MKRLLTMTFMLVSLSSLAQTLIKCEASSNGYLFEYKSTSPRDARLGTTRKCYQNMHTNDFDCRQVTCSDKPSNSVVRRCETYSNGKFFKFISENPLVAKNRTQFLCSTKKDSNPTECIKNLECFDVYSES